MSEQPENPQAFPSYSKETRTQMKDGTTIVHLPELHEGMTLRDYFAAKAMPQLMVASVAMAFPLEVRLTRMEWVARGAYKYADAMLKERAKK